MESTSRVRVSGKWIFLLLTEHDENRQRRVSTVLLHHEGKNVNLRYHEW